MKRFKKLFLFVALAFVFATGGCASIERVAGINFAGATLSIRNNSPVEILIDRAGHLSIVVAPGDIERIPGLPGRRYPMAVIPLNPSEASTRPVTRTWSPTERRPTELWVITEDRGRLRINVAR